MKNFSRYSLLILLLSHIFVLPVKAQELTTTIGLGILGSTGLALAVTVSIDASLDATENSYMDLRIDAIDYLADGHESTRFKEVLERTRADIYPEEITAEELAAEIIARSSF